MVEVVRDTEPAEKAGCVRIIGGFEQYFAQIFFGEINRNKMQISRKLLLKMLYPLTLYRLCSRMIHLENLQVAKQICAAKSKGIKACTENYILLDTFCKRGLQ